LKARSIRQPIKQQSAPPRLQTKLPMMLPALYSAHVEFQSSIDDDGCLRTISDLKSREAKSLGLADEKSPAQTASVLRHPISAIVPTDHEKRRTTARRRFGFLHFFHRSAP
jgi:hypothetical protein